VRPGKGWRRCWTGVAAGLLAIAVTACSSTSAREPVDTVGRSSFANPLAIPPLAESKVGADGVRTFELEARRGEHEFVPGTTTPTMGYNGAYLGPTLRAARGERVRVNVHNSLGEATTLHWHGMHLPAAADGGPHQPIAPGAQSSPSWEINQPAASLWYHPHPHGNTEEQVGQGLAGMFILDDEPSTALRLPHTYGVDDVPLIVQDFLLDAHGQRIGKRSGDIGTLGNTVAVNGVVGGYFGVTSRLVRLRLLNASAARTYHFAFSDGRQFSQIASDGGLLAAPHPTTAVLLSPGERAEVIVAFNPAERVTLQSTPFDLGVREHSTDLGTNDRLDLLQFRAAPSLSPSVGVPAKLATIDRLDPATATTQRAFELEGTEINNHRMDMGRVDLTVTLGTTEIWTVRNGNGSRPHNFHIHGVQFQVLDIDGRAPPPELGGWKDTVLLPPDMRYRLIMRFTDYADPAVPYMYHCHLLWHEDQGMMGQFVVVAPGAGPAPTHDHPSH
jgi:FtsP/CotA-like multicopper oxidase with cupredoxin domain